MRDGVAIACAKSLPPRLGAPDWLARGCAMLTVAALAADVAVTFASSALRFLLHRDLGWAADLSTILMAIIAFVGGPTYFRGGGGMAFTAALDRLRGVRRAMLAAVGHWVVIGVCVLALLGYPGFLAGQTRQALPVLGIPASAASIWLGVGLVLLVVFALEKLARLPWRAVAAGLAAAAALALVALTMRRGYESGWLSADPFWLIVPVLGLAFVAGTPIPLILALGGGYYFMATGDAPLVAIPTALQYGASGFILLAIPFFLMAGALMEVTSMARRLVAAVQGWVGHWAGGLLIAEVIATYIFSGISGSKAADMATIGAVMKAPTRARGYPPAEFAAVLCASAAMSETVPPSLAMLILGSVTSLSIGALFVAGIVPAIVLAAALIVAVVLRARRHRWDTGTRFVLCDALAGLPLAIPALGVPLIVIGGIVGGLTSPTEAGSFAVVYGLAAVALGWRGIGAARFYDSVSRVALTAGMILLMVAAANVLAQAVVLDGLATSVGGWFAALHSRVAFLFCSVAALVVIGFMLEGFPAILIAAPLFLPAARSVGVDPLQFGILLIMATGIGVMMPPVGIGFYIACTVGDAPIVPTMRASLVYNLFLLVGLAVVVLLPQVTLWLPRLLGLHG